jgi:death-on-curing protein
MRYLTIGEVITLHRAIVASSGGADGLRDLGALESAIAQPRATFDSIDLYPSLVEKAGALAHGWSIDASVDEQERLMLDLAAGNVSRIELTAWLTAHVRPRV